MTAYVHWKTQILDHSKSDYACAVHIYEYNVQHRRFSGRFNVPENRHLKERDQIKTKKQEMKLEVLRAENRQLKEQNTIEIESQELKMEIQRFENECEMRKDENQKLEAKTRLFLRSKFVSSGQKCSKLKVIIDTS